MSKTVWVINDDEGRTQYVCTTKDNADMVAQTLYGSSYVSEMKLDEGVKELRSGAWQYQITMLRDGTVERIARVTSIAGMENTATIWERTKAQAYKGKGTPDCLQATVWGKSPRAAIKVVDSIRLSMIEERGWPNE